MQYYIHYIMQYCEYITECIGGGNGQGHVLTGCGVLPGNVESMPCNPAQLTIAVARGPLQAGALRVGVFLPSRGIVGR